MLISFLRCWISGGEVVCLCQRDVSNFYPHMSLEAESIKRDILTFFSEHIRYREIPLNFQYYEFVLPG